ncbi:MAG: 50S ribosomal protein L25 [Oligosphaeraceae bacterium]|nr:50S ribosomal protein L25 [Oligosphaeraceae bacterium]
MSNAFTISVQPRQAFGSANSRRLRRGGSVPAVLYGAGEPNLNLSMDYDSAEKLFGHSGVVELKIDGQGKRSAITKEIANHPISGKILHVDFLAVKADEPVILPVPVISEGTAVGEKSGGQLEQILREIEVECLPANVPDAIRVDVSALELDESLLIADLQLGEGVTAVGDPEQTVFQVRMSRVADVDEESEEEAEGGEEESQAASEAGDEA